MKTGPPAFPGDPAMRMVQAFASDSPTRLRPLEFEEWLRGEDETCIEDLDIDEIERDDLYDGEK